MAVKIGPSCRGASVGGLPVRSALRVELMESLHQRLRLDILLGSRQDRCACLRFWGRRRGPRDPRDRES